MKKYCLVVNSEILKSVFGEEYWNDVENIICIPTRIISPKYRNRLSRKGLKKTSLDGVEYLIAEHE
jgi:hypothetical protein